MNDHLGSLARSARGEGAALLPVGPPVFVPAPEPPVTLREGEAGDPAAAWTSAMGRRDRGRAALPYPTAASATSGRDDSLGPSGQGERPGAPPEGSPAQAQPEALLGSGPDAPAGPPDQSVVQSRAARSLRDAAALRVSVPPEAQNEGAQPLGRLEHLPLLDGAQVGEEVAPAPPHEQRPQPRVNDLGGMTRSSATSPDPRDQTRAASAAGPGDVPMVARGGDGLAPERHPGGATHEATPERLEEQRAQQSLGSAPGRPPTVTVTGILREPPVPTVSGRRLAADPTTAETIRVSIGRIEVRAVHPPAPPEPEPPRSRVPALSLDDYLRRRDGRGSG